MGAVAKRKHVDVMHIDFNEVFDTISHSLLSLNLEDMGCISRQNGGRGTGSAGGPEEL